MTRTRVVNVRHEHCDVYAGRGGPLGNPYVLGVDGDRAEVIRKYRVDFHAKLGMDPEFKRYVLSCRGKALGCHCAPLPCHVDVVVEYLEGGMADEAVPGKVLDAVLAVEMMGADAAAVEKYMRWLRGPHDGEPEQGYLMPADYSTSLGTAFTLLEDSTSRFLHVRGLSSRTGADYKLCRNYPGHDRYWVEYMLPGGPRKGPESETPAMAICLAALECVRAGKAARER